MSVVQYHRKSAQTVGDEKSAAAQFPGSAKAAGARSGVLQEVVAEKTGNSLCSPLFLGH